MKTTAWNSTTATALGRSRTALALGVLLFTVLTALSALAKFPLPFSPVPITLQTLFVILSGAVLGPVGGALSMLLYIGAGASGLPVFAGGTSGPGVLVGPTGGYLAGFVVAAWTAGLFVRNGMSWPRLTAAFLVAHAVVFVFGVSQLTFFLGGDFSEAMLLGVTPFLPGMIFKTAAAVAVVRSSRLTAWLRS